MTNLMDIDLHDLELANEIELLTALMVAASEAYSTLEQSTVDALLT